MEPLDEANLWLQICALIKEQEDMERRLDEKDKRLDAMGVRIEELERQLGIDQPES